MTHRVDASYPVPGQYISSLKPRSKSRKWGKDAEKVFKGRKGMGKGNYSCIKYIVSGKLPS